MKSLAQCCALIVAVWCGCASPQDAPGCEQNTFRCDGEILQMCLLDASDRESRWFDVEDCTELEGGYCFESDRDTEAWEADCEIEAVPADNEASP